MRMCNPCLNEVKIVIIIVKENSHVTRSNFLISPSCSRTQLERAPSISMSGHFLNSQIHTDMFEELEGQTQRPNTRSYSLSFNSHGPGGLNTDNNFDLLPVPSAKKPRAQRRPRLPPSPEKKAERNLKQRERRLLETLEQREERLERARQRAKLARTNETTEHRQLRLEKQRMREKDRRARETSAERERRVRDNRLRSRARSLRETPEIRASRLEKKRLSTQVKREEAKKLAEKEATTTSSKKAKDSIKDGGPVAS